MWEDFIHHIYDIFYILQWLIDCLKDILAIVFSPLTWIFNFSKGFLVGINVEPGEISFALPSSAINFLQTFPSLNLIFLALGGGLGIFFLAFIMRKIIHL